MHDRLVEAHARLSFLKIHLPETSTVEEKYILEFHDILHLLEQASGCDLGSYRIPAAEVILQGETKANGNGASLAPATGNGNSRNNGNGKPAGAPVGASGSAANSDHTEAARQSAGNGNGHSALNWCALEPACPRATLMHRIDGVLTFFGVQASTHRVLNRLAS